MTPWDLWTYGAIIKVKLLLIYCSNNYIIIIIIIIIIIVLLLISMVFLVLLLLEYVGFDLKPMYLLSYYYNKVVYLV